ncbi:glutamate 5-kinase [Carnobacterium maltaromaticum]|uniref:glutamate 5-kinase n=1 Tax=Carnobacterium maltaromaticum TaxID=2751 RepID=UPI000704D65B|nr:glutamate 5-kinase [Carnobacterium maltaromaticum]KRN71788.1 gamma-glutamyl kinase [Carnobacterium maltaromaticum]KRN83904.1 gamma-glutamyl kinase [Carnobacterium maltaromaticum]MBC9809066.1 glutamate 5-kinase [Carnobacterium maltaromaticum]TFJ55772.1 glutamate 5-kinase [Carnobacterium maltaromaticum]CRH17941.1 Glutamate 5-kinase [Carnobacterium maltaromaticum]
MVELSRAHLNTLKRIVIKVGTSTLMYPTGAINLQRIEKLAFVLTDLKNQGKEVILVSSGAIGVGCHRLKLTERPTTIPQQQAVAAVGQSELMSLYSNFFNNYSQVVGQVLLTRDVIEFPESRTNVTNTFNQLLAMDIIPIVNENDTVAVDELEHQTKFGDNDSLSALVTELTQADLLIMLSDIDGFYDKNPTVHQDARLFSEINEITADLLSLAGGNGSKFGTGGMITKLNAAEHVLNQDSQMILANGAEPTIIFEIMHGENIGTHFLKKKAKKA